MRMLIDSFEALDAGTIVAEDVGVDAFTLTTPDLERMVRRYVSALSRDVAAVDDLTQEVFVRAIERIDRLRSPDDAGRFLRGIARHVVQEHFRACRRGRRYEELTAAAMAVDSETIAVICDDRATLALLADAMDQLPLVSRRMLEMRYHDGLSAAQIARKLGIGHTAVRVTLLRIRDRLRRAVERVSRDSREF